MKKTLFTLFSLMLIICFVISVAGAELEAVERFEETAQSIAENATLSGVAVPGKNIFTGTPGVLTFDGDNASAEAASIRGSNYVSATGSIVTADVVIGQTSITATGTNKVLKFTKSGLPVAENWFHLYSNNGYKFENRKYRFHVDYFYEGSSTDSWGCLLNLRGTNSHGIGYELARGKWKAYDGTDTPANDKILDLQYKVKPATAGATHSFYVDNVFVAPYYKITYKIGDGIDDAVEFVAPELTAGQTYTPLVKYYPNDKNINGVVYICVGWSTVENATEPMKTIALNYEDIILYPVFAEADFIEGSLIQNGASGEKTYTANKAFTSIDVVKNVPGATVVINNTDNTIKVTANGYAGEVKLVAHFADGTPDEEVTIKLIGATKFKPGLDIVTGITTPMDFENAEETVLAYTGMTRTLLSEDNKVGNSSDYVMRSNSAYSFIAIKNKLSPALELARPVKFSFDYKGTTNQIWVMGNGAGANDKVATLPVGSKNDKWYHYENNSANTLPNIFKTTYATKGIDWLAVEIDNYSSTAPVLLDNVSFIPYYKVTYHVTQNDGTITDTVKYILPSDGKFTPDNSVIGTAKTYKVGENGEEISVSTPYTLNNEDIDVYVTFKPDTFNLASIRTTGKQALRFSGFVSEEMNDIAGEYGMLIGRKDVIGEDELTVALAGADAGSGRVKALKGIAYSKVGETVNRISAYRENAEDYFGKAIANDTGKGYYFTASLINIPEKHYKTSLVGRTYIKIGDSFFYGDTVERSIYEVALAVQASEEYEAMDPEQKALIDNIVTPAVAE